jgi:hypothetical protein
MAEPDLETLSGDELKAYVKKLSAQATSLKMDLHDLAEDLPNGWQRILDVAQMTQDAFARLETARKKLATP